MGYRLELLAVECLGKTLNLEGSIAGWQQLFWEEQYVSQISSSADNDNFSHQFSLQSEQGDLQVELNGALQWQPFELQFKLLVNDELMHENTLIEKDIEQRQVIQGTKQRGVFTD